MLYFINIGELGNLYIDKILFEFENIPIVFICKNDNNDMCLCLCTDSITEYTWLVTKININLLNQIMHDEVFVYEGFKNSNESIYLINQKDNHFLYNKYLFSDLPKSELPEDKIYL